MANNNDLQIARRFLALSDSAKNRGLLFDLSFSEFKKIYNKKKCYYSNISLVHNSNFSFDRIDNSKGYISGNIVACDKKLNEHKSNLSIEEITQIYFGIQKKKL